MEFLQDYILSSSIRQELKNKVADTLNRRVMILVAMSAEVTGFERLQEYESCPEFGEIYVALWDSYAREMDRFLLQDRYLFKFCSYVFPVRPSGTLSWEVHPGGLAGHFNQDKTIEVVEHIFYWLSLKDVAKAVGQYRACQLAKQQKQIVGPYAPLPVPNCS